MTKSYENLDEVSFDKLIKLRDVVKDNVDELYQEYEAQRTRYTLIQMAISKRMEEHLKDKL